MQYVKDNWLHITYDLINYLHTQSNMIWWVGISVKTFIYMIERDWPNMKMWN